MENIVSRLDSLEKRIKVIEEHLGIGSISEEDYDNMPDEEKDNYDRKQVMERKRKEDNEE